MYKIPKLFLLSFTVLICLVVFASPSLAISDPRARTNNHVGIHIIDENDIEDAAKLVNSGGGSWGYVKIVIREDDRNVEKWQAIFDKMRRLKIIPIIRLATRVENGVWIVPKNEDIGSWVDFLAKLNWVTENRYVVIFNEPNHAKEWGGTIDPEGYGHVLKEFSVRLKEKSPDFFILPAGLDASAPNSYETMDETLFIKKMVESEPAVFNFIDGWSSHSYPNPGFVGSPYAVGRGSVATFLWEQNLLSTYGKSNLPIFILETGWMHSDGKEIKTYLPSPYQVGLYYQQAISGIWNNQNIVAVVPFLLNYQDVPFDHFSMKRAGTSEFNPIFEFVSAIPKKSGNPAQVNRATILTAPMPTEMVIHSTYTISIELENVGQSILSTENGWSVSLEGLSSDFITVISALEATEPNHRTKVEITIRTPEKRADFTYALQLKKDGEIITQAPFTLTLIAPPSLMVNARLWFNTLAEGTDFNFLIYDTKEKVVYEQKQLSFENGKAEIENIFNIVPNEKYRFVLTKPYYLPRQVRSTINKLTTNLTFPPLLPFDPSLDGKLSFDDVGVFINKPLESISRWLAL